MACDGCKPKETDGSDNVDVYTVRVWGLPVLEYVQECVDDSRGSSGDICYIGGCCRKATRQHEGSCSAEITILGKSNRVTSSGGGGATCWVDLPRYNCCIIDEPICICTYCSEGSSCGWPECFGCASGALGQYHGSEWQLQTSFDPYSCTYTVSQPCYGAVQHFSSTTCVCVFSDGGEGGGGDCVPFSDAEASGSSPPDDAPAFSATRGGVDGANQTKACDKQTGTPVARNKPSADNPCGRFQYTPPEDAGMTISIVGPAQTYTGAVTSGDHFYSGTFYGCIIKYAGVIELEIGNDELAYYNEGIDPVDPVTKADLADIKVISKFGGMIIGQPGEIRSTASISFKDNRKAVDGKCEATRQSA